MKHCASSYVNHEGIYSLRDSQDIPHCTFEVDVSCVQQIKGKANGKISPKYIKYVLACLSFFGHPVNDLEMINIGYTKDINIDWIKQHFTNHKIITISGDEYLYTGKKIKLVKNFSDNDYKKFNYFCKFNQSIDAVKLFIKNGVTIHKNWEFEPLMNAARKGFLDIIKSIGEHDSNAINRTYSLLVAAVCGRHMPVVKYLVEDIGVDDEELAHALYKASFLKFFDYANYLVEHGANMALWVNLD